MKFELNTLIKSIKNIDLENVSEEELITEIKYCQDLIKYIE